MRLRRGRRRCNGDRLRTRAYRNGHRKAGRRRRGGDIRQPQRQDKDERPSFGHAVCAHDAVSGVSHRLSGPAHGGGLHGKDLSKADVSINIYAWLKAQETGVPVELVCAIGDDAVDGIPYERIVETARTFIDRIGGFEKFAEWGLIC